MGIPADSLIVGQPAPFSIFSTDGSLLLAQGLPVENARIRDMLLEQGQLKAALLPHRDSILVGVHRGRQAAPEESSDSSLRAFQKEAAKISASTQVCIRASRNAAAGTESFVCKVLGADEKCGLMIGAPRGSGGGYVTCHEGEIWTFRAMLLTAAFKFEGSLRKIQFEPIPLLYVTPNRVEMREVRTNPRVPTSLPAIVNLKRPVKAVISDLGLGGLCLAVDRSDHEFEIGETVPVSFVLKLLGQNHTLTVCATVVSIRTEYEQAHPNLSVIGARIEPPSELEALALHAFVQERLAQNLSTTWRVLFAAREA